MFNKDSIAKENLQKQVKEKFGKPLNSLKSFEEISENLNISSQTLRRFFGKIDKEKDLGFSSLSVLCRFVGFKDWNDYLNNYQHLSDIDLKDKIFIESMEVFFRSGEIYKVDYLQKTITTDTLNDYAKVIYKSKENTQYFYKLYQNNTWAKDYIFAWLPNYNFFGQNWFREILKNCLAQTKSSSTKLALCNFLNLGHFLTNEKADFCPDIEELHQNFKHYKLDFVYSPYHEMRYQTILLIEARKNNDTEKFGKIAEKYLKELKSENLSIFHYQEMLVVFCNTLLWLQDYERAFELLKPIKSFITNFDESSTTQRPMHYLGINKAFIKTTFALAWLTNKKEFSLDIKPEEFRDTAGLLYNDYIRTMYLATCILAEKTTLKKKKIFEDLQSVVSKTAYTKIYTLLADNDVLFDTYFS